MSEFKSELPMSDFVVQNMSSYGVYTIETKLPNSIDGLKPVQRRILLKLHEHSEDQKESTLAGRVMEMHPHGDAAISMAISCMAQPFTHIVPLVYSDSNIGNYDGDAPAAPRYVLVSESEEAKDLFFADINPNMWKMVPCESESGLEPANLIPILPTALLIPSFGIALAYKSYTCTVSLGDLCKLTKEYIKIRTENLDWRTKAQKLLTKYLYPDFPKYCTLRNSRELMTAYRKGDYDYPIAIDGRMSVTESSIIIRTVPPDKTFNNLVLEIGAGTQDKSSWEYQNFQQMEDFAGDAEGAMLGAFTCIVRRGVNPFDVLSKLKSKMQFTSHWSPIRRYDDADGSMHVETPFTILDKWYRIRYTAVLGDLKYRLSDLLNKLRIHAALIIIADHKDEAFDIIKNSQSTEAMIPELRKKFGLTDYQAGFVAKLQLGSLTIKGREDLVKEMGEMREKMKELQSKFHRVGELMIDAIEKFERKYADRYPRRCLIPKYIGAACYKGNGWCLFEKDDEIDQICKDFDPESLEFHFFRKNADRIIAFNPDESVEDDVPQYIKAANVTKVCNNETYTACVLDGGAMILEGVVSQIKDHMRQVVPISKEFISITKQGNVTFDTIKDKYIRKSDASGPTMKDVVYILPVTSRDVIVVHASSAQSNYLMIERVTGDTKLKKLVVGTWKVLAVFDVNDRCCVNIPKEFRTRCVVNHIVMENMGSMIAPNAKIGLLFGRGSDSMKTKLDVVPFRKRSTIMTVVSK